MMSDNEGSAASESGGEDLDQGRRYWKAAIAHLAPEKREAAWEFYLDRLESSAAADTLGGVMLLLEAHLAFFDELPAALGAAAQRLEIALAPIKGAAAIRNGSLPVESKAGRKRLQFSFWAMGAAVIVGASLAVAETWLHQRFASGRASDRSVGGKTLPYVQLRGVAVEPWNDSVGHRVKGCVVILKGAAWTETTRSGEAKVFVYSPVEEVRQNLRSLEEFAR